MAINQAVIGVLRLALDDVLRDAPQCEHPWQVCRWCFARQVVRDSSALSVAVGAGLTLAQLAAVNAVRQREWDPSGKKMSLTYRANELAGETGEACNIAKKLERERLGLPGSRATVEQLADELGDVVICADLLATSEGIDLGAAVARKFNATSRKVGLTTTLPEPAPVTKP
jgi:NTP pyrophosphatase (non-canonical NTP hydrolase)